MIPFIQVLLRQAGAPFAETALPLGDLVAQINGALLALLLLGLMLGLFLFRGVAQVGPWFAWTLGGYILVMVLDGVAIISGRTTADWYLLARYFLPRLILLWGVWYCFLYGAFRARP
jgi:hypothetical protein